MRLDVLDWQGKIVGEHHLNDEVFSVPYNQKIVHEVIRWQRNKQRQPIQQAKVRSDVAGAHRKIRPQKGSGKARQGDGKACHFRGGGVAFGINPRTYEFKLNKKFRKKALCSFLSQKARNDELIIINDQWNEEFNKTQFAKKTIDVIAKGKSCTIVANSFENTRGLQILHDVYLLNTDGINIYSCMKNKIIFHLDALKIIEHKLGQAYSNTTKKGVKDE